MRFILTERAKKDWDKLDNKIQDQLRKKLRFYFENDPMNYVEKLKDNTLGEYRFRVGDYRVICDKIKDEIIALRIGHRKDIYKD